MNHQEFSKKGGQSKSEAKSIAAKANWLKAMEVIKKKRDALGETPKKGKSGRKSQSRSIGYGQESEGDV